MYCRGMLGNLGGMYRLLSACFDLKVNINAYAHAQRVLEEQP